MLTASEQFHFYAPPELKERLQDVNEIAEYVNALRDQFFAYVNVVRIER